MFGSEILTVQTSLPLHPYYSISYWRELYPSYCIKTVRAVPQGPHEGPRTIVQSFGEKDLSTKFHHFCAKYVKNDGH